MQYGVVPEGFKEKPNTTVLSAMIARWREFYPQADESEAAVQVHLFKTIAAELADRGLQFPTSSVWATLSAVYFSAYVLTANDASLDDVIAYRGLKRRPAMPAKGTAIFSGPPNTSIPQNTLIYAQDGFAYATSLPATLPQSGKEAIPVAAVLPGVDGNRAAGIPLRSSISDVTVSNAQEKVTSYIEANISNWVSLDVGSDLGTYQLFNASELSYPAAIKEIVLKVRNPEGNTRAYYLQLLAVRNSDGIILGHSAILQTTLRAGEERELTFITDWNLLGESLIRLVLLNLEGSWGRVSFATKMPRSFPYALSLRSVPTNQALYGRFISVGGGGFTDGRHHEDDESLRKRYMLSQFTYAGSNVESLRSRLWQIEGVRDVHIPNEFINDTLLENPHGMPPLSVQPIVWGGDPQEIAETIFNSLPVGLRTFGNTARSVKGYVVRFSRPIEVPVQVRISNIKITEEFPADGQTQITQQIVQAIGGYDAHEQYWPGNGIAMDLPVSLIYAAVHRVPGIESFRVEFSRVGEPLQEKDIPIGLAEVAQTHPSLIQLI